MGRQENGYLISGMPFRQGCCRRGKKRTLHSKSSALPRKRPAPGGIGTLLFCWLFGGWRVSHAWQVLKRSVSVWKIRKCARESILKAEGSHQQKRCVRCCIQVSITVGSADVFPWQRCLSDSSGRTAFPCLSPIPGVNNYHAAISPILARDRLVRTFCF